MRAELTLELTFLLMHIFSSGLIFNCAGNTKEQNPISLQIGKDPLLGSNETVYIRMQALVVKVCISFFFPFAEVIKMCQYYPVC